MEMVSGYRPEGVACLPPQPCRLVTVTAVRPPARFGGLIFDGDTVTRFTEKPQAGEGWINVVSWSASRAF